MDPVTNPYSPGAGRPPAALVGRDRPIVAWQTALKRTDAGRNSQSLVLYGLRGVGKTVLLNRFAQDAEGRGWIVAQTEAGNNQSLRRALGEALHAPLADLVPAAPGRRLLKAIKTALSFNASYDSTSTWNLGVDVADSTGGGADTGELDMDLPKLVRDLAAAAADNQIGLAILIDEAQDLDAAELTAVCATAHVVSQRNLPVLFALAGLPSLPRVLADAKSYAERLFAYEQITALPEPAARAALTEPAASEGTGWESEAVVRAVTDTGGYPYFLQQFGQETWNCAAGPAITDADARVGAARTQAALDDGFFRVRWDRATSSEQQYMQAMALDQDLDSSSGEIARRLHRRPSSLGPVRSNLIGKGLVYAPGHGKIAFTVPRMAHFIQRQVQP